jgi:hypothetical protein
MNDDNSSSIQENINNNTNNENIKKNLISNINVTVESSLLSNLNEIYGFNNVKNEYIFNSLNTSVLSDFSLVEKDKNNQIQNPKYFKKPLKNSEFAISNINSTTNLSSNEKPASRCTCKNSNCLKCYCECFANGRLCDNCICINCKNTQEFKELRLEKYNLIISRNPKAIQKINSTKRSWTCKCKNSNCSKKYCDCFQNRRFCTSKCRCINCFNKNNGPKNKNNNNERKIKRIRGIKKDKMNKLIRRKIKRSKNKNDNENINNKIINNNIEDNKDENEKKIKETISNYYTPKKQRNSFDRNNYIYYQNESTTAAFTGKRERKKLFESKEKKRIDVYTKLQMENI